MSTPELLVLHAVRLLGFGDEAAIAARFELDPTLTHELLLDYQASGWVSWSEFAGLEGWSLTESGRAENERQLAVERPPVVKDVYEDFLPLNGRLQAACTNWQLRPTTTDLLAVNDHTDPVWDEQVVGELAAIGRELIPLVARLTAVLPRFAGYDTRFTQAKDVETAHRVWFELHEDLIATLGVRR
ncbi:transcriptional regulator [Kribbella antibiotica]|uniref:Transcriptional regulator n=1 Tax=Kribbella antibiotica TaxID=190195 RepID=A0A4R4ZPJ2_9ACTN|nr:transcriptional regulator [Kribbella antibiotica]TDD59739.1 transcriptional regulator [Kribbella antibiotica]